MPAYAADARYLRAGLRAAAAGLPVALQLSTTSTPPSPTPPADWLFWLSDAPLPAAWHEAVRKGAHVWQEAPGAGAADTASLAMTAAEEALVTLFRRDKAPPASTLSAGTVPIWADGRGRAVLSRREFGKGAVYQLHTRLSPAWSEIADSPILPTQLLSLLEPELAESTLPAAAHDQRALDPAQFSLTNSKLKSAATFGTVAPAVFRSTDLRPWLVLAAGLLFALERLLARRREAAALSSTS
jgi:hypothetical protein